MTLFEFVSDEICEECIHSPGGSCAPKKHDCPFGYDFEEIREQCGELEFLCNSLRSRVRDDIPNPCD